MKLINRIFGLGLLLLLAGCQTGPTLVGVWPALTTDPSKKASVHFRLAQDTNSDLLGIYYRPYKVLAVISYDGSYEEAKASFESLSYVNEVQQLESDAKYEPVNQILVNFAHSPLPKGELLGQEIIETTAYKGDSVSKGFVVIKVKGPITAELIDNLDNMPGVRFFEPNYTYSLPENE